MIRSLLKLGLLAVIGVLVYNFFLGTDAEKANAQRIFQEVKDVGKAVGNLVRSEKEKFDEGKYDDALSKIGNVFNNIKDKANDLKDSELLDQITNLEQKKKDLERRLHSLDDSSGEFTSKGEETIDPSVEAEKEAIRRDMSKLMEETEAVVNKMEHDN